MLIAGKNVCRNSDKADVRVYPGDPFSNTVNVKIFGVVLSVVHLGGGGRGVNFAFFALVFAKITPTRKYIPYIYNGNIFPSLNPAKIFQFISR